jgi:hypothetical protein
MPASAGGRSAEQPQAFLTRRVPSLGGGVNLFGNVLFGMSGNRFQQGIGFLTADDITVRVTNPGAWGVPTTEASSTRRAQRPVVLIRSARGGLLSLNFVAYSKALSRRWSGRYRPGCYEA